METYKITKLFNGEPRGRESRRFASLAGLARWLGQLCGAGWGARISITDQQARRLGVYESRYGEMLLPVPDADPLSVTIVLSESIQSAGGHARAKSLTKRQRSDIARKGGLARRNKAGRK